MDWRCQFIPLLHSHLAMISLGASTRQLSLCDCYLVASVLCASLITPRLTSALVSRDTGFTDYLRFCDSMLSNQRPRRRGRFGELRYPTFAV